MTRPRDHISGFAEAVIHEYVKPFSLSESSFKGFVNPKALIDSAWTLHPDHLCVKDAYGAMVVNTELGNIFMYGRNGMAHATPQHLQQFSVGNLRSLAKKIDSPEGPELTTWLGKLAKSPERVITCKYILEHTGCAWCIKGLNWDEPNNSSRSRKASDFCPNNRAEGCTERMFLLTWLPYVLQLQKYLAHTFEGFSPGDPIHIKEIKFDPKFEDPIIYYSIGDLPTSNEFSGMIGLDPMNMQQVLEIVNAALICSQTIPCPDCTKAILKHPLHTQKQRNTLEVNVDSISRHRENVRSRIERIDRDDIHSIFRLIKGDLLLTWDSVDDVLLRMRN
jgi:hypothetical protein